MLLALRCICLALLSFAAGCEEVAVTRSGRPCAAGRCAPGYVCHPDEDRCVPAITVGCDEPDAVCPEEIVTGAPCSMLGSFIPCTSNYAGCEAGCRTCQPNGTWSECSCRVGQLISCRTCTDDCTASVRHATPVCQWIGGGYQCDYEGDCETGWVDLDGITSNGCECQLTAGGAEICDRMDNDCDGEVDEENPCAGASLCVDGSCVPCTDSDDDYCGPSCAQCAGSTPRCLDGRCGCFGTSCGAAQWCDAGVCTACADDDAAHCGPSCAVCPATLPECEEGVCRCNASSCGPGHRCSSDGACLPCADADYCGPSCVPCPIGQPVCAAATGVCTCRTGTCPAGSYCQVGGCTACDCPTLFPACTDLGNGTFRCDCTSTSCPHGGACIEQGATCRISDDFEAGSLLTVCNGAVNSTWARGTPNYDTFTACASGNQCWATHLTDLYANCENSCLDFPTVDLARIDGTVELTFAAKYLFEYWSNSGGYDGATVRFHGNNVWEFVTPESGWNTNQIRLETSCSDYTFPTWPGWGQYGGVSTTVGWTTMRFQLDSATNSTLFAPDFFWRLSVVSDRNYRAAGFYLDDVVLRIHRRP